MSMDDQGDKIWKILKCPEVNVQSGQKEQCETTTSVSLTRSDSDVYVPCADKTSLAKSKHSKSVAIVLGRVTHDHKHRLHTCNSQKICVSYRRKIKSRHFKGSSCFVTVASGGQLCFLLLSHVAKSGAGPCHTSSPSRCPTCVAE